jgi:hypothetical protein
VGLTHKTDGSSQRMEKIPMFGTEFKMVKMFRLSWHGNEVGKATGSA